MSKNLDIDSMIEKYLLATIEATGKLYQSSLYGHLLVVVYSAIDTVGLLDAPSNQTTASGQSFKDWVKKYLLIYPDIEFNEIDLWGARCAVLHTFTSQSDLSQSGKAKELMYFGGDKNTEAAKTFDTEIRAMQGGNYLPVHFETLYLAFIKALGIFATDLAARCKSDKAVSKRLSNVLQTFQI
jgi:hypothetical protein